MCLSEGKKGGNLLVGMKKEGKEKERDLGVPIARLTGTVKTLTSAPSEECGTVRAE